MTDRYLNLLKWFLRLGKHIKTITRKVYWIRDKMGFDIL